MIATSQLSSPETLPETVSKRILSSEQARRRWLGLFFLGIALCYVLLAQYFPEFTARLQESQGDGWRRRDREGVETGSIFVRAFIIGAVGVWIMLRRSRVPFADRHGCAVLPVQLTYPISLGYANRVLSLLSAFTGLRDSGHQTGKQGEDTRLAIWMLKDDGSPLRRPLDQTTHADLLDSGALRLAFRNKDGTKTRITTLPLEDPDGILSVLESGGITTSRE